MAALQESIVERTLVEQIEDVSVPKNIGKIGEVGMEQFGDTLVPHVVGETMTVEWAVPQGVWARIAAFPGAPTNVMEEIIVAWFLFRKSRKVARWVQPQLLLF